MLDFDFSLILFHESNIRTYALNNYDLYIALISSMSVCCLQSWRWWNRIFNKQIQHNTISWELQRKLFSSVLYRHHRWFVLWFSFLNFDFSFYILSDFLFSFSCLLSFVCRLHCPFFLSFFFSIIWKTLLLIGFWQNRYNCLPIIWEKSNVLMLSYWIF